MFVRRACCLLSTTMLTTFLLTPPVTESLTLRGRWSASVDDADGGGREGGYLRRLVVSLRRRTAPETLGVNRQQQQQPPEIESIDSGIVKYVLSTIKHQTDGGRTKTKSDLAKMISVPDDIDAQPPILSGMIGISSTSLDVPAGSRMETYRDDEVQRIKQAISDAEAQEPKGVFNPFRRHVEPASSLTSKSQRQDKRTLLGTNTAGVFNPFRRQQEPWASSLMSKSRRRDTRTLHRRYTDETDCLKFPSLVNESCNSLAQSSTTAANCSFYLMCVACNSGRDEECSLHYPTSIDSPCTTSGDDITVMCHTAADMRRRLLVDVGACAIECAPFFIA